MASPNFNAVLQILASITGGQVSKNEQTPLAVISLGNSPGLGGTFTLKAGDNPFSNPSSGATWSFFIMIPPTNSAVTKILRFGSTDTGYALGNSQPLVLPIGAVSGGAGTGGTAGSFLITASGQEAVTTYYL